MYGMNKDRARRRLVRSKEVDNRGAWPSFEE